MGLVKADGKPAATSKPSPRKYTRDLTGLLAELNDQQPKARRWAARDLVAYGEEAVGALCERLRTEPEPSVREALFDALLAIGGDAVVEGLIPLLRGEDAGLRNGAVEVLGQLPEAVGPRMEVLLADPNPDVRLFGLDILRDLPHPEAPRWLMGVLEQDPHVNVVTVALDRLAEVGTPEMIPAVRAVKDRFPDEPFVAFAVDTALDRILGGE
ncbi:HEAT repeat domain-containing protein [Deferrisoma camini]|uniref:HEAT repeat domain-containing protein n=1 Tax=Deferrisoma camini TaxID=1035120 RepID=UPI00046D6A22|nr:HEAT repeat domain-containing protein [Deferrisoma camini]